MNCLREFNVYYLFRWRFALISFAIFTLSFIACISLLLGYWVPASRALQNKQSSSEMSKEIARVNEANEELLAMYKGVQSATEKFDAGLLNEKSKTEAITALTELLGKCGLEIVSESFSKTKNTSSFEVYTYDLDIRGPYKGVRLFLIGLEEVSVRFYPYALHLARNKNGQISGQIRLEVYRKRGGG